MVEGRPDVVGLVRVAEDHLVQLDAAELAALLERPPIDRLAATRLLRGALLEGFPALEQPFDDWLTDERRALIAGSPVTGEYDILEDRDSAYEVLGRRAEKKQADAEATGPEREQRSEPAPRRSTRQTPVEAAVTSSPKTSFAEPPTLTVAV